MPCLVLAECLLMAVAVHSLVFDELTGVDDMNCEHDAC